MSLPKKIKCRQCIVIVWLKSNCSNTNATLIFKTKISVVIFYFFLKLFLLNKISLLRIYYDDGFVI
jgi:hypothetical protein